MLKSIKENCYLYSLWSGRLVVHPGHVHKGYLNDDVGRFQSKNKSFGCSIHPGVMYNSVVWLEERNDDRAKDILIEYEETQITALQEKIDNHLHKIKILKE